MIADMKFVYLGYDFMLGTARRLVAGGHELAGIFTFPCDNVFNFNIETVALAKKLDLFISFEKPGKKDIELLREKGAQAFIAAGYLYKIPDVAPAYGLNIHPSLLPRGRGLMPLPYILLDHPDAAGFTIHKLADEMDGGDILYQEALPLAADETVETLSGRMAAQAPEALLKVMADLPGAWKTATPQNEAEILRFPPPDDRMRLLDWNLPLERLDKIARAFGHFGSLADFDGSLWAVYAHEIKTHNHGHAPGTVISTGDDIAIAARGGLFILKKFEKIS